MTDIFARRALLPGGWANGVRLSFNAEGIVTAVETGVAPRPNELDLGSRILLPAPANLHSHAFQRGMAGMTEHRSGHADDFWSWRTLMYRFLDVLTPEAVAAIAALAYVEMLEAGYAAVGEFHYVHHQPGGEPYDDIAELSRHIFAAAAATGIGLTHLPVLYSHGGAGGVDLAGGQLRFGCDLDRFAELFQAARDGIEQGPADWAIGVAPHSLRAIVPEQLTEVAALAPDGPIHIHIGEQRREVREIEAWLGARPVSWLMDRVGVDARWCLVHATHMDEAETVALARSQAAAGLCPVTEANLGDGAFNGRLYLAEAGRFGIGTDSNVRISLAQELRQLEYSQRQRHEARNVMAAPDRSTGNTLYRKALEGGAQALGRNSGALAVGRLADLVAIDGDDVTLCALGDDQIVDGWIFAAGDGLVRDVWSAGRHCVADGRHVARDAAESRYRSVMKALVEAL